MNDRQCEVGQSLVEFAVSVALLILVFLGAFDLGRAFNTYIIVTNAAREGAYFGAMHPEQAAGVCARAVAEAAGSGISLTCADVAISTSGLKGDPITVSVIHDFRLFSGVVPGVQTIRLRGTAEMVVY